MRLRLAHIIFSTLILCLPTFAHATGLPVTFLSKARVGLRCWDTGTTDAALDCWLNENPAVSGAMFYADASFFGPWSTWPTPAKDQLHQYFDLMVAWYKAGMPASYPKTFPVPIPTQLPPEPLYGFLMSDATAHRVYLSQLANNSLAIEPCIEIGDEVGGLSALASAVAGGDEFALTLTPDEPAIQLRRLQDPSSVKHASTFDNAAVDNHCQLTESKHRSIYPSSRHFAVDVNNFLFV